MKEWLQKLVPPPVGEPAADVVGGDRLHGAEGRRVAQGLGKVQAVDGDGGLKALPGRRVLHEEVKKLARRVFPRE